MTKKAAKPRPLTCKQVLRVIDRTLACGGGQAKGLWAVLTALRGPDYGNHTTKRQTTAVIRSAAFPCTATNGAVSAMFANRTVKYKDDKYAHGHFRTHADRAAAVLGLTTATKKA